MNINFCETSLSDDVLQASGEFYNVFRTSVIQVNIIITYHVTFQHTLIRSWTCFPQLSCIFELYYTSLIYQDITNGYIKLKTKEVV